MCVASLVLLPDLTPKEVQRMHKAEGLTYGQIMRRVLGRVRCARSAPPSPAAPCRLRASDEPPPGPVADGGAAGWADEGGGEAPPESDEIGPVWE